MISSFVDLLRNNELKATTQRVAILDFLYNKGHASIEEIYNDIKVKYPSISLNTIYLNIELLTKSNILTQISLDKTKDKYEITKKEHMHLICTKCFNVIDKEIPNRLLESLYFEDFSQNKRVINVYGICKECRLK